MYLHFEDWSAPMFLQKLERAGLPHADKIIKVFASERDPRLALGKSALTVVSVDGSPFLNTDKFEYPGRETFTGSDLERKIADFNLGNTGNMSIRSLFRFANEHGFCQAAMAAETDEGWLVDHPFGDIDGIDVAQPQAAREHGIHLDIFFPDSLKVLKRVVDYDDPDTTPTMREGQAWFKQKSQTDTTD